jgi:hypothetical protein
MPVRFQGSYLVGSKFEKTNRKMITKVLPNLTYSFMGEAAYVPIFENKWLPESETLADACAARGISYADLGLWLDRCIEKGFVETTNGPVNVTTEKTSIMRLDQRSFVYLFDGIPIYALVFY